jgi:DUF1680 family protein
MRGPLLYCVEQSDNPGVDRRAVAIPDDAPIRAIDRPDLLGGVVALQIDAALQRPDAPWSEILYRDAPAEPSPPRPEPVTVTAIPYHAWANRAPGPMRVWLRR